MPLRCFNFNFQDVPVGPVVHQYQQQQQQDQHEGRVGEQEEEGETLAQVIKPIPLGHTVRMGAEVFPEASPKI